MSDRGSFESPFSGPAEKGFIARLFRKAELPAYYFRKYRREMIWGLVILLFLNILELVPPLLIKWAIDSVTEKAPLRELLILAGAYFGVFVVQGFCRYGWRVFLIRSSHRAGRDLRGSFVQKLFRLPASFFEKNRVGDLMALANSDVESVRQFIGSGVLVLADAVFYLASVPIAMLFLDWKLALISFIPLPLIPWIAYRLEELIHDRYKDSQDQFSRLSAMAQENLNGVRVVKAYAVEDVQSERFRKLGETYIELNLKLARADKAFGPLMDFFTSLGIVLLLWFGGIFVIEDAVSLGTFVAFQRYIQKMVWPMIAIGFGASLYQRSNASSQRLKEIFQTETNVPEVAQPNRPERVEGRIEIRDLTFRFPEARSEEPVLKKISLTIEPGMRVAFVGEIGSGKTALLSLIPRIYPAPAGTVFVDGVDVNDWPIDGLRREIGMVSQEVFLFSESVRENIAFGLEGMSPEEKEARVRRAVTLAALAGDIERLPLGEGTQLGERGVNLSGGQKQRTSLARALARQPKILILDDALSAVDVKTEEKILSALRDRSLRNTELISAHRISTVKEADLIVVLKSGEIVQRGKHEELIRDRSGLYWRFYEQQRLKEELENYLEEVPSPVSGGTP